MPPVGFESTISAGERPQTYALDRAATGTGKTYYIGLEDLDCNVQNFGVAHFERKRKEKKRKTKCTNSRSLFTRTTVYVVYTVATYIFGIIFAVFMLT